MPDVMTTILGGFGILFAVAGLVLLILGLANFSEKKGKWRAIGGGIALVLGIFLVSQYGIPSLQFGPGPSGALDKQVEMTNANGCTIEADDVSCAGVINVNSSSDAINTGGIWWFNATVTLGGDDSNQGLTYDVKPGSIPEVAHSSDTTISGPVVGKQGDGDFDVIITVGSTNYDENARVTQNELSSSTIAFKVNWATVLAKLDPSQYPRSFTVTYVFEGAAFGSATLSLLVTVTDTP